MAVDSNKPGAAFWATMIIVVALAAYPLSVGPACWASSRANFGAETVSDVYRPLTWGMARSARFADAVSWYSGMGAADDWGWSNGTWIHTDYFWPRLYSPRARTINRNLGVADYVASPPRS
jgi:hypothetical protein